LVKEKNNIKETALRPIDTQTTINAKSQPEDESTISKENDNEKEELLHPKKEVYIADQKPTEEKFKEDVTSSKKNNQIENFKNELISEVKKPRKKEIELLKEKIENILNDADKLSIIKKFHEQMKEKELNIQRTFNIEK
jgi:hypothetical protein